MAGLKIPAWLLAIALLIVSLLMVYSLFKGEPFYINGKAWGSSDKPILTTSFSKRLSGKSSQTEHLGRHQFCALSEATTYHNVQACSCSVARTTTDPGAEWLLNLSLDPAVNGQCACAAACID